MVGRDADAHDRAALAALAKEDGELKDQVTSFLALRRVLKCSWDCRL